MRKRAGGGDVDPSEEAKDEMKDASKTGEEAHGATEKKEMKTGEELKSGGRMGPHAPAHHPRKRGGKVPGKMSKGRPDRRSRGGSTSDMHPTTAAGNMSEPSYQAKAPFDNGGGSKGGDSRGPY